MGIKLPILYKKAKSGKVTQSFISTDGATVITETGYVDGQKTHHTYEALPKNTGRANATTAEEQAIVEAKAKHVKALKSKYVTDPSGETTQKLPRKVGVYQDLFKTAKTQEKLNNTVYVEDKYNGVNGTFWLDDNNGITLTSRGGESFPVPPHLADNITYIMMKHFLPALNVELYIHGTHLQDIQSAVTKPNENSKDLVAVIFAFPELEGTYEEQVPFRMKLAKECSAYSHVQVSIPTRVEALPDGTLNKKHIHNTLVHALSSGMEGIMVINPDHVYKYNERSSSIWKYKLAQDAEFKIIGMELDKKQNPTLICESAGGNFKVRPKGDQASRDQLKLDFDTKYLGNFYKVEFECLSKQGKPTKPVGIGLRKCDEQGQPLE